MENSQKYILALDTCCSHLSVALVNIETGEHASVHKPMVRGLVESLFPSLEELLDKQKASMKDVVRVGVTRGPGSFTSVRIGLTAVRGFRFSLNMPVFGWNTLEALAKQYGKPCEVWHAAHGRNVFVQKFGEDGMPISEAVSLKIEDAVQQASGKVIGDGLFKYPIENCTVDWDADEKYFSIDPVFFANITKELSEDDVRREDLSALYVHALNYDKVSA